MSGEMFCPATMCPLFARDGSPWTGDKNSPCDGADCLWFDGKKGICNGGGAAFQQIAEVERHGGTLQIGPVAQKRDAAAPRSYDCPRAHECQWQKDATDGLCPPRFALGKGVDPRACAY